MEATTTRSWVSLKRKVEGSDDDVEGKEEASITISSHVRPINHSLPGAFLPNISYQKMAKDQPPISSNKTSATPMLSNTGYDEAFVDLYVSGTVYGNATCHSSKFKRDKVGLFEYGLMSPPLF
ncbi:hypothetical protein ACFE04_012933 [Oxalis oulophora]